jgi:predicted benzoate:H+ symporter BenE
MDRRTLVAIGLTVGLVALVLASMASGEISREYGKCAYAALGLLVMSPGLALLGAFVCAVFLAARGSRPVAYILLVAALAIVAGSIAAFIVGLSELCGGFESLSDTLLEFAAVAAFTGVAALIGLVAGWVPGRLVRWFRER